MKLLFASLLTVASLSIADAQPVTTPANPAVVTPVPGTTPAITPTPAPTATPLPVPLGKTSPVPAVGAVYAPTPISSPATPQTNMNSAGKGSTTIGNTYAPTNAAGKVVPRNP